MRASRRAPATGLPATGLPATGLPATGLPAVVVPSGNVGNLTAGILAKRAGLPLGRFVAATNANALLPDVLAGQPYAPRATRRTLSTAMDVGNPSNLARLLHLYGSAQALGQDVTAVSIIDDATESTMRALTERTGYVADPHTAVGVAAWERVRREGESGVVLATAHPAKFPDEVARVLGDDARDPGAPRASWPTARCSPSRSRPTPRRSATGSTRGSGNAVRPTRLGAALAPSGQSAYSFATPCTRPMDLEFGPEQVGPARAAPDSHAPDTHTPGGNRLTDAVAALPADERAGLDAMTQTIGRHLDAIRGGATPPPNFDRVLDAHDDVLAGLGLPIPDAHADVRARLAESRAPGDGAGGDGAAGDRDSRSRARAGRFSRGTPRQPRGALGATGLRRKCRTRASSSTAKR